MSDRLAYQTVLPNGATVRTVSCREITHCVMQRTDRIWKACWCSGSVHADRQLRRFIHEMLHKSGLRPDQYEARIVPVASTVAPSIAYVYVLLPGRRRAKAAYYPAWGEAAPIAVLAVSDGNGWTTGCWVTSREQQDREFQRLKKLHDRVTVVEVRGSAGDD